MKMQRITNRISMTGLELGLGFRVRASISGFGLGIEGSDVGLGFRVGARVIKLGLED